MASGGGSTLHAPSSSRAMTRRTRVLATTLLACALTALAIAATGADAADPLSIDAAIARAATQLEAVQLPDGSFGGRLAVRDSATGREALRLARPTSPATARLDTFLAPLTLDDVDDLARAPPRCSPSRTTTAASACRPSTSRTRSTRHSASARSPRSASATPPGGRRIGS
jgi:hypothetical protein